MSHTLDMVRDSLVMRGVAVGHFGTRLALPLPFVYM
jgi:hypothetical protein